MVFELPPYWDVAVDGVQVILCLLILLFLFGLRRRKKQAASNTDSTQSPPAFNDQVFIQSLKQQVDQSLANIAQAVAVEQRNLDKWIATVVNPGNLPTDSTLYQPRLQRMDDREPPAIAKDISSIDEVHEQIQNLADQGMSAQQISEKLKAPLGEVELVLSLGEKAGK